MSFEVQPAADLIPQRPPFVMVDSLLFADASRSRCGYRISGDGVFVNDGLFSTAGMVEAMAQTAAAGTGYLYKKENRPVPVGYIGAVQNLHVTEWPPAESEIEMEIKLLTNILQVSLVSGELWYQGKIIARCEMKIFINNRS